MNEQEIQPILQELQPLLHNNSVDAAVERSKDKDVILFMGITRAGKSTIVNHIIGNPLTAEHVAKDRYRINHSSQNYQGPTIGLESVSETTLPSLWTCSDMKEVIVDAPGFNDNRGEAQDIANVFHIRKFLHSARSVKIVIVSNITDVTQDNVSDFISVIDKVKSMFGNVMQQLLPGIVLVLNKDRCDTTKNEVANFLNEKILSQTKMKVNNRELVKYLQENKDHIVIVKMPDSQRALTRKDPVFDDLIGTIQQIPKIDRSQFQTLNFGLSDKSKAFLYYAHTCFTEHRDFETAFNECSSAFNQSLNRLDAPFGEEAQGNDMKNSLQIIHDTIQVKLDMNMSAEQLFKAVTEFIPESVDIYQRYQIYQKLKFVAFVDHILIINDCKSLESKVISLFSTMKQRVFEKICTVTDKIQALHSEKMEQMRLAEEERIRKENEELERLKREHEEQQRRLESLQNSRGQGRGGCTVQ